MSRRFRPTATTTATAATATTAVALSTALILGAPISGLWGTGRRAAPIPVYVRVDQAGYPDSGPKVAFVMSPSRLTGAAAVVDTHGRTVASPPLGTSLGAWNATFRFVYRIDFSALRRDGTYTVRTHGANSPDFPIAPAPDIYTRQISNALSFYENERDGPNFIRTPLRTAPGHLNDRTAAVYQTPSVNGNGNFVGDLTALGQTIDASGGWWDAGDYLKFVETTSYTVAVMLEGIHTFPAQMGGTAPQKSDFTAEAKFGLDFLMRMWNQRTRTLYYQVGIGGGNTEGTILSDHDIWRLPQVDDTYHGTNPTYKYIRHRPVFGLAPSGSLISPNLAGRLAADFGLCYQVFHATEPALARSCLIDGETVFGLARTTRVGRLTTAIPYGFYPEKTWQDDLELGATELYSALADGGDTVPGLPHPSPGYYLHQAARWAAAYIALGPARWSTLNLYDVAGLAHYRLYRAIGAAGNPPGLAVTRSGLLANLQRLVGIGATQAAVTPFGNGAPWNMYDSVSLTDGLSVMASEYDALTGSSVDAGEAQVWMDQNLGSNPWGLAFLVGDGSASPDCLQHQVANIVGNLQGQPPILDGAAVEGPNASGVNGFVAGMRRCSVNLGVFNSKRFGVFADNMQSYDTTEPAIDLTASSPLALAWRETSP
jgi:endoglucanase